MASLAHTLKTFWNGKRLLKLLIFALIMANVTMYAVGILARRQVINTTMQHHEKIYTAYLQAVERARKLKESQSDSQVGATEDTISPYWIGLRDVRKQFPFFKVNLMIQSSLQSERDRQILDLMKNKPHGWQVTDEIDGWARSFYVLPTKNTAAFQAVSYVRDDLRAWEVTAMIIGGYAFLLLCAFGWFWTRGLDESSLPPIPTQGGVDPEEHEKMRRQLVKINGVVAEMEGVLADMQRALEKAPGSALVRELDEIAAQIRLLAVNGSIEAARSAESFRVFHVMMQEINQLATHTRELLKKMDASDLKGKVADLQQKLESSVSNQPFEAGGEHGSSFAEPLRRAR